SRGLSAQQKGRRVEQDPPRRRCLRATATSAGAADRTDRRDPEAEAGCSWGGSRDGSPPSLHDDAWCRKAKHPRSDELHAGSVPDPGTNQERILEADPAKLTRSLSEPC